MSRSPARRPRIKSYLILKAILVASDGLTDQELERWIARASGYAGTLPPK
jgi:hypothetical protein